jgi:hypothetical protein
MWWIIRPISTASVIFLLAGVVLSCDRSFDPNTDKFTIATVLKMIAPLFVLASLALIVPNVIVFFFRKRKFLFGVFATILSIAIQYVAVLLVISLDTCLVFFPVLAIIETVFLILLTMKHIFRFPKISPAG